MANNVMYSQQLLASRESDDVPPLSVNTKCSNTAKPVVRHLYSNDYLQYVERLQFDSPSIITSITSYAVMSRFLAHALTFII